jgi:DNA-binding transcriptional regulator YiaG
MTEARHTCRTCGARVMVTFDDATTMTILHAHNGRYVQHEHQDMPKREPAQREQGPCRAKRQPFDRERLRRARVDRMLSAYQAALLLGVTRSTYSLWESGRRWPSPPLLERIAEELPEAIGT